MISVSKRNGWLSRALATMNRQNVSERRAENLKAMRSPGSFALACGALLAVLVAFAFYDHPIADDPVLLTHLRGSLSAVE